MIRLTSGTYFRTTWRKSESDATKTAYSYISVRVPQLITKQLKISPGELVLWDVDSGEEGQLCVTISRKKV